ncbi:hypothetical protein CGLAMM_03745 [Acetobacteraceae bacterium EV16G]|uniref:Uncharacterized protein n=2 Tax=Sorlinia euscelidii TaxID=3081148 RepID=A0ABU7TZW2_9PROT
MRLKNATSKVFQSALKTAQYTGSIEIVIAEETNLQEEISDYISRNENAWTFSANDLPKSPAAFWQGIANGIGDVEQSNRNKMVNVIRHLKKVGGECLFIISDAQELSSMIMGSLTNVSSLKVIGLVFIGNRKIGTRLRQSNVSYTTSYIDNIEQENGPASSDRMLTPQKAIFRD